MFSPGLRDGTVDFVIANLPIGFTNEAFEITPLFKFESVIGARGSLAGLELSNLKQLRQYPWIVPGPDAQTGEHELINSLFSEHQIEPPKHIIRCESLSTGLGMMVNSDLIGLFTKPLADLEFQRVGLKTVPIAEKIPDGLLALVSRKHLQRSLVAERLVALLTRNASRFKREKTEVGQVEQVGQKKQAHQRRQVAQKPSTKSKPTQPN